MLLSTFPSILLVGPVLSAFVPEQTFLGHTNSASSNYTSPIHDSSLDRVIANSPLLSLHRALVEVNSISNHEHAVGRFLQSTLEAHNFTVIKQKMPQPDGGNENESRYNIFAYPRASAYDGDDDQKLPSPKIIFSSHIDTVPPYIPYTLSRAGSKKADKDILISGRGTVDAKACVASMIQTTLELLLSQSVSPLDMALLFVVGEETRGDGMKDFSESRLYTDIKHDLRAVIFGEPTEGKLASGHKGISMAHIIARGKAAHSGYPWLGRSANSMILPALFTLDKLGDLTEEEGGLPRSKEFGNSTVNVGYIMGGVAANVVPEHAEARVAFRLAGGTPASVKKIILNAINGADPKGKLEVDIFQGYGPVPLDTDIPGFGSMVVNYGTDVPNLAVSKGVKRYLYGPGSILVAHGKDEALTVGDLEQAVVDYKSMVKHILHM